MSGKTYSMCEQKSFEGTDQTNPSLSTPFSNTIRDELQQKGENGNVNKQQNCS